ncbi:MAG: phytanoyl-CoA dioxygenase family protein [Verrucomicrobia bacterium]|nr:phytanoyl-CoA dioxygenase family protein [Verrucomicrobiota bacterium]
MTQFLSSEYWKQLAPELTIGKKGKISPLKTSIPESFAREGYVHLSGLKLRLDFEKVAKTIEKIVAHGLPPVFIFVYDELWKIRQQLAPLVQTLLGGDFVMLPDFWAWCVKPGQAGWKPHRDKGTRSLFPDKSPKSITVWFPITKAYPLNGCMYVVPADRDPDYGKEGNEPFEFPEIRALPAEPGDVLAWTQHLLHWGSRSADLHNLPPRMSAAFEFQRLDVEPFNQPLLDPLAMPTFEERLALIGKQVMQYKHMYKFSDELVGLAWQIGLQCSLPRGRWSC